MRVAIIDYGMGNLRSICNAFEALEATPEVVPEPRELAAAGAIVLPGVGAFAQGMEHLVERGWRDALEREVREKKKPFLGICLGMQFLASFSMEHGKHVGLGWVPGEVEKLQVERPLRLPHIGWNDVRISNKEGLYAGMEDEESFYFVHSYGVHPEDASVVDGLCIHGEPFAASLATENIMATQYHPEKSHRKGLALLGNFLKAAREC